MLTIFSQWQPCNGTENAAKNITAVLEKRVNVFSEIFNRSVTDVVSRQLITVVTFIFQRKAFSLYAWLRGVFSSAGRLDVDPSR